MKVMLLVCAAGFLLLCLSGCRCGCLTDSGSKDLNVEAVYREMQTPSCPVVSTQLEFQARYGKSF